MSARRGRALGQALVVAMAACMAVPARADDGDSKRAAARALATEGAREIDQGRWAEGIDKLERAEAIVHAPPHLLYIARALAKLGKLVKAHETYIKMLREELPANAPKAFVEARRAATAEKAALEPRLAKLTIALRGATAADVGVTMDGVTVPPALVGVAQPADPGAHVLRVSGPGYGDAETKVTLADGANETAMLNVVATEASSAGASDSPSSSRRSRFTPVSIAALGVGGAGIAVGVVFMLQNRSHRGDANDLCRGGCPLDKRAEVESLDGKADDAALVSWIGFGVGAAGIIAGTTLVILRGRHSPPAKAAMGVSPWIGAGAAGLRGTF